MPIDPRPAREWPIPPMDHGSGHKDAAFTWAMEHLILQRIADGEAMRAITADTRMPAYCTVFRWMQVVPDFGDAVAAVRAELARRRLAERTAVKALLERDLTARRARGERVRWWASGRRSSYDPLWAEIVLEAVEDGESLGAALAAPGMPSPKAWYRGLRNSPELAARYAEACRRRAVGLTCERDLVIENVMATGIPAANAALRDLDGRIGRLTPKTYRTPPAKPTWV